MIYEPSEDSFLIQKYVKKYAKGKVLDIGTGSGILAETALKKTKDVLAIDINEECVEHTRKKGINCIKSDLFENVKGKFDLIIFNPPYLPMDKNEPRDSQLSTTGGKKGYEIIERFLKKTKGHLEEKGKILLVCSSLTGNVELLFKKYRYNFKKLETKKLPFFEELYVYLLKQPIPLNNSHIH